MSEAPLQRHKRKKHNVKRHERNSEVLISEFNDKSKLPTYHRKISSVTRSAPFFEYNRSFIILSRTADADLSTVPQFLPSPLVATSLHRLGLVRLDFFFSFELSSFYVGII